jgi:hypothetical protein
MNGTGKLLPMSSVRSVTYVAGCSVGVPVPQQKTVEKKNIRSQEAGSFH